MPKTRDYGVNLCDGCLDTQREIDRLKEENQRLKQKLYQNQQKSQEGFFGSATSSALIRVKANSLAENQAKKGGASKGQKSAGRKIFSASQADQVVVAARRGCRVSNLPLQITEDFGKQARDL